MHAEPPRAPALRRVAATFATALAALVVMLALDAFARAQVRASLVDDAVHALGALAHGDTPLHWNLRDRGDVIAGRAFGAPSRLGDDGVHVVLGRDAAEIGLVLRGPLDLHHYTTLAFSLDAAVPLHVSASLRERFDGALCDSAEREVPARTPRVELDLHALAWRCDGATVTAPVRAAMLRIRVRADDGGDVRLADVALRPASAIDATRLVTIALPAPRETAAFAAALREPQTTASSWPVYTLPDARVETTLAARDAVRETHPAAVVVPASAWSDVQARAAAWTSRPGAWPAWTGALAAALLGLGLFALRVKPPVAPRLRAALELAGVIAAPLVIVLGGFFDDDLAPAAIAAIVVTLAFAASLLFGAAPTLPTATQRRRGWAVALATVAIAVALAFALHEPGTLLQPPSWARVLRYLGWAALQQFLVCVIVAGLIERVTGSRRTALVAAAALFALLHAPNAMLMQLTFVAGLAWIANWQRHRALLPNLVAHVAASLLLAASLPADVLRSAEVSARYLLF
ncbi:CPBP family glutamic-type intramembrane protease [Dokdonella sp. MW10]|uniref:CPBP family glutamic-type intramembrane protease n=1 Tax=Dokdonella sp. MW10 TaxID=2992926 RepID=UPI003F8232A7